MPNSRIEVSNYNLQQEIADAWKVSGNNVIGGKLGTTSANDWIFISQGVERGGFRASGTHYLRTHGVFYSDSEFRTETIVGQTNNSGPLNIFTLPSDDNVVWNLTANVQARRSSGIDRGVWERKVMAYREGSPAILGKTHTLFTDTTASYNVNWITSGNDIILQVTGLSGHTVFWTGTINYQAVKTNL